MSAGFQVGAVEGRAFQSVGLSVSTAQSLAVPTQTAVAVTAAHLTAVGRSGFQRNAFGGGFQQDIQVVPVPAQPAPATVPTLAVAVQLVPVPFHLAPQLVPVPFHLAPQFIAVPNQAGTIGRLRAAVITARVKRQQTIRSAAA